MNMPFTERLKQMESRSLNDNEEAADQRDEIVQEEQAKPRRGPKKRVNKDSTRRASFNCPWELDARLDRYRADRKEKEERTIEGTEVIVQALDEFLIKEGYPPSSSTKVG